MEQNNKESEMKWIINFKNELPYNKKRYTMIAGFTILIILVVYLGYARGALDVCNDLGGRLEVKGLNVECRPGQYNTETPLNDGTFIMPDLPIQNVG